MMLMVEAAAVVPIQALDRRNVVDHRKTQSHHQALMVRRAVIILPPNANLDCLGPSGTGSKSHSKPSKPASSVRRAESAPTRLATASDNAVAGPSRLPGVHCFCDSPAGIGTSNSGKSHYKCETSQQCGFFQWTTAPASADEPMPIQVVPTKRLSSTAGHCFFAPLCLLDYCDRDKILIRTVILRPGTATAVSVLICSFREVILRTRGVNIGNVLRQKIIAHSTSGTMNHHELLIPTEDLLLPTNAIE